MGIINRIVLFFGGFTEEKYHELEIEYINQRELVVIYRAGVEFLEKELNAEKAERKQLQELIFKRFGISYSDETECGTINEPLQPINSGSQRWSNLRSRLEKDDQMRMKETGAN